MTASHPTGSRAAPTRDQPLLPRVVLVGVDGRLESLDAVALGARVAQGTGARLVVAAAYPLAPLSSRGLDDGPTGRAEAERALGLARRALGAVPAGFAALAGSTAGRSLHEAAEQHGADLIVVGSSRHGPRGRLVLGGVTAETLRRAPCGVAVAPRGWSDGPRTFARIGVAVDGSARDIRAARLAGLMAGMSEPHARVEAIHVVDPAAEESAAQQLRATARAAAALGPDIDLRRVVVSGEVADQLAARSAQLDLLVLGGRPRGIPGLLLLGDVSAQVVGLARCPVLALPSATVRERDDGADARSRPAGLTAGPVAP